MESCNETIYQQCLRVKCDTQTLCICCVFHVVRDTSISVGLCHSEGMVVVLILGFGRISNITNYDVK